MSSPGSSPCIKKPCHQSTPESMRFDNVTMRRGGDAVSRRRRDTKACEALFQDPSVEDNDATVKFSNLPKPFHKLTFIRAVEKVVERENLVTQGKQCIKHCYNYESRSNSVLVQFSSHIIAREICHNDKIVFEKHHQLTVQPYNVYNERTFDSTTFDGIDSVEEGFAPLESMFPNAGEAEGLESHTSSINDVESVCITSSVDHGDELTCDKGKGASRDVVGDSTPVDIHNVINNLNFINLDTGLQRNDAASSTAFTNGFPVATCVDMFVPTNCVKVTGLLEEVDIDGLKYEIHKALWKSGKVGKNIKCITDVDVLSKEEAIVKFSSVLEAQAADDIGTVDLIDNSVSIKIIKENKPSAKVDMFVPTNCVKVTGLLEEVDIDGLKYEIHKALWKSGKVGRNIKCITDVDVLSKEEAIVKFSSVLEAQAADDIGTVDLIDSSVSITIVNENKPSAKVDMFVPTNRVKVTGLLEDVDIDGLKYEIHKALWKSGKVGRNIKCITDVDVLSKEEAIVKFSSVLEAQAAVDIGTVDLIDSFLLMEIINEKECVSMSMGQCLNSKPRSNTIVMEPQSKSWMEDEGNSDEDIHDSEEESATAVLLKDSAIVKFGNMKELSDKADFIKFILKKMRKANFIKKGENCISKCYDFDKESSSVIVKFNTCEEANLACLLGGLNYNSRNVTAAKCRRDSDNNFAESTPADNIYISVDSAEGKEHFIKYLAKHRDRFPKSGCFDSVLQEFIGPLKKKGVLATLSDLRKVRKSMKDAHRRMKRDKRTDEELFKVYDVLFGQGELCDLTGTVYQPDCDYDELGDAGQSHANDVVKYSSVATWSMPATQELVRILIENKEEFVRPIKKKRFWDDVSLLMTEKRFFYTADQCENKLIKSLKPMFKEFLAENGSGAAAPWLRVADKGTRELLTLLEELLGDRLSVRPYKTISSGFLTEEVMSREGPSQGGGSSKPRHCLARPTVLKRNKNTIAERKLDAFKERTDVVKKSMKLFERSLHKKKKDKMKKLHKGQSKSKKPHYSKKSVGSSSDSSSSSSDSSCSSSEEDSQ